MARTGARSAAVIAAAILILTGCTSGPSASVTSLETSVQLASGPSAEPADVGEQVEAALGSVVSTDAGGLAEVVFPDTSLMRLGPDSEIVITELGAAEVQRTSIGLDIGSTWHVVEELVADDAVYEVVTPVGVASVKGTVFSVICIEGPSCEFIVIDGEVEIDSFTLTPYQRIVLPAMTEPETIPTDALPEWVTQNLDRDAEAEGAVALPDPPLEAASIAGDWAVTLTTTASNNTDLPVGGVDEVTWKIGEPECEESCTVTVTSVDGGWTADASLSGGALTFPRSGTFQCIYDDGTPAPDTGTFDYTYALQIAEAAEPGTASAISGEIVGTETLDPQFTECDMHTDDGGKTQRYTRTIELVRG